MKSNHRNLFAAGSVVGPEGGAFVVVKKLPRKTGRIGRVRKRHGVEIEERWEDEIVIVVAERLAGSISEMLDLVAQNLEREPLASDCVAYVETTVLGSTLRRFIADRGAGVGEIAIGGNEEVVDANGAWTVPLSVLHARMLLLFDANRISRDADVDGGAAILRSLERLVDLPAAGPTRDLALATSIAVWAADRTATNGPWASSKAPPEGSPEALHFEEQQALRELADEKRRARGRGWARSMLSRPHDDDR